MQITLAGGRCNTTIILFLILATSGSLSTASSISYETIAVTGDPVHGTSDGSQYGFVSVPKISQGGDVTFFAILEVGQDIVRAVSSTQGVVVRSDVNLPGTDPNYFPTSAVYNAPSASGTVAFTSHLIERINGTNFSRGSALSVFDGSRTSVVAQTGDPVPGVSDGAVFSDDSLGFFAVTSNNAGQLTYSSRLATGTGSPVTSENDSAIFGPTPTGLGLLAREGLPIPGGNPGEVFHDLHQSGGANLKLNDLGHVAFLGNIDTPADGFLRAIFGTRGGGLEVLAREGDPVSGINPNTQLEDILSRPSLNNNGDILFWSEFQENGVETGNGIFSVDQNGVHSVIKGGDLAPSLGNNVELSVSGQPVVNGNGDFVFEGSTIDFDLLEFSDGLFTYETGQINQIAKEGNVAPGATDGALFGRLDGSYSINSRGDVLFDAELRALDFGSSVNDDNDEGIYAYVRSLDELILIAREGDLFDVNSDPSIEEWKTISRVTGPGRQGPQEGLFTSINDMGQLTFALEFDDGTWGVFLATLPVPEPSSLLLAIPGILLLFQRRLA